MIKSYINILYIDDIILNNKRNNINMYAYTMYIIRRIQLR